MSFEKAENIANAILYEGYMLYPYRPSAIKNQQRWNFGTLYPPQFQEVRDGTERSNMHVECLMRGNAETMMRVRIRFLQLHAGSDNNGWADAQDRVLEFAKHLNDPGPATTFMFAKEISGSLRLSREIVGAEVQKIRIDLFNTSVIDPSTPREQALSRSFISAHLILRADPGEFISLLEPPESLVDAVAGCKNVGCFPVLVGEEQQRNMLLCSPIILYDYPQIAEESAGDFFDGTEMDEMLTLRVMTLTSEEKCEIASSDDRARDLLERTERTAREQLVKTHGTIRSMRPAGKHE